MPKRRRQSQHLQKAIRTRWTSAEETAGTESSSSHAVTTSTSPPTSSFAPTFIPSTSTLAPSTPSTSTLAPSTPSTSTLAPSTPSTSTLAPSTPSTSTLAPSTPSTSTLAPSTPSTSTLLPPSTPSTSSAPPTEHSSRSKKKFALYTQYAPADITVSECVRTITEMQQIGKLVGDLCCPECHGVDGLKLESPRRYGLSIEMNVICNGCGKIVSSHYTSERNPNSQSRPKPFVVNETSALASLLSGMGPYSFNNFCEYMEMPGLHQSTFNTHAKRLYAKNEQLGREIFDQAAAIVRQENASQDNLTLDDTTILDIAVCFDGSWLTRGHKSLIGIGSIIDVLTGLIIDAHVCCLYCHVCSQTGEWIRRETPNRFQKWKEEHVASGECTTNFEGTSGLMEVKAAEILWSRSVAKHKLRYTTMVSDGDSKAFNKISELKPYGPDIVIDKEDCLNHVGKRMGTALRNLVSDCSKRGITLGGKGHGRLTMEAIRKLQIYYTRAIRGNKTPTEMQKAILASLYHGYSSDDFPQHQYCPPGRDSWCFYKRAIGEHHYPTGHKKRVHTPLDYDRLHRHLEPIYQRLSSDDLLRRCERKTTQNPSESFHHSVWSRCSKKNFHSLKRVQLAVVSAAAEYNSGPAAIATIKTSLGFSVGQHGQRLGTVRTQRRLEQSTVVSRNLQRQRKKKRAAALDKARQEKEQEEGGPAYQAGMF